MSFLKIIRVEKHEKIAQIPVFYTSCIVYIGTASIYTLKKKSILSVQRQHWKDRIWVKFLERDAQNPRRGGRRDEIILSIPIRTSQ